MKFTKRTLLSIGVLAISLTVSNAMSTQDWLDQQQNDGCAANPTNDWNLDDATKKILAQFNNNSAKAGGGLLMSVVNWPSSYQYKLDSSPRHQLVGPHNTLWSSYIRSDVPCRYMTNHKEKGHNIEFAVLYDWTKLCNIIAVDKGDNRLQIDVEDQATSVLNDINEKTLKNTTIHAPAGEIEWGYKDDGRTKITAYEKVAGRLDAMSEEYKRRSITGEGKQYTKEKLALMPNQTEHNIFMKMVNAAIGKRFKVVEPTAQDEDEETGAGGKGRDPTEAEKWANFKKWSEIRSFNPPKEAIMGLLAVSRDGMRPMDNVTDFYRMWEATSRRFKNHPHRQPFEKKMAKEWDAKKEWEKFPSDLKIFQYWCEDSPTEETDVAGRQARAKVIGAKPATLKFMGTVGDINDELTPKVAPREQRNRGFEPPLVDNLMA